MNKKVALFAFCLAFVDAAFALHNSDNAPGWTAGWSWDGGRSKSQMAGMTDDDLIDLLYTKPGSSSTDHPSLKQRLEYRRTYEVTEDIDEGDYVQGRSPHQYQEYPQDYDYRTSSLENSKDYAPFPDNSIGPDPSHPQSSSSSMFMTSGHGDSIHTVYSHKIIHQKK